MKFHIYLCSALVLACLSGIPVFAVDVTGEAPKVGDPLQQYALNLAFNTILSNIGSEVMGIDAKPEKLMRSFADASVFSSSGATQRAFEGYNLFAVTVGAMGGIVLPSNKLKAEAFTDIPDTLKDKGDVTAGLNIQLINGQIGVNTSAFLLKNLYLGLKFGYFNLSGIDNFTYNSLQIGLATNYQFVRGITLVRNRFSWSGFNFGSGLIYQRTNIKFDYPLDSREEPFGSAPPYDSSLIIQPELVIEMLINTFVVPLEVNTSFKILFFNMNFGFGADLAFGKNHTTMDMSGTISISSPQLTMTSPGYLTVDGGGDISPSIINPKLMMNLGFKFGPVVLDIPVTYYFLIGPGLNLGVTLGAVF